MKSCFIFLLFFVLIALTHLSSLSSGFMEDDFLVLNGGSKNLGHLLQNLLPNSSEVVFRPLLYIIFGLEYFFFGHAVNGYHWVSWAFFAGACTAIYFFVKYAFRHNLLAVLTAVLYALHPINQNSVNSFSSSYINLYVVFTLGCIYWGSCRPFSYRNIFFSQALFILALLCNETTIMIPLYVLAFATVVQKQPWRKALSVCAVFFCSLGIYFLFQLKHGGLGSHLLDNLRQVPIDIGQYVATFIRLLHWYVMNLFSPDRITLIWSSKLINHPQEGWWLAIGLLWIILFVYLFIRSKNLPAAKLGLLWLAIGFMPVVLGCFYRSSNNLMIEPYWFAFSSIGFFLFIAALLTEMFVRTDGRIAAVFLFIMGISWIVAGHIYNGLWEDDRAYGAYYVQHAGDYTPANMFMANVLLRHREPHLAEHYMARSHQEQLPSDLPRYYADLGFIDFQHHRLASAKENYLKAIAVAPQYYPCYTRLGIIEFMQGDLSAAEKYFLITIKNDPSDTIARLNMAAIYNKRGEVGAAVKMLRDVLRIDAYSEAAWVELFKIYVDQKDSVRALEAADWLLKYSRNPVVLRNIGLIYQYYGRQHSAKEAFGKIKEVGF